MLSAIIGAVTGNLKDQYKEFIYCDSLGKDTLLTRGKDKASKKGNDNIISEGSGVAVADGQCMIIVTNGQIVEFCAQPGNFIFQGGAPSVFTGSFGQSIKDAVGDIWNRIQHGGAAGADYRVYYFNTKEITDNKFGTQNPIPFRVVDNKIGLDIDVSVRCSGVYSYKITDPILFYTNVCGNVPKDFERSEIDNQLKTEFVSALQPAMAKLSEMEMRPNAIPGHVNELTELMNQELTKKWSELRGISVVSIALNPIVLPEEDQELIKQAQRAGMNLNPGMAAANMMTAQADAMRAAASNTSGAVNGFMAMNMAQNAGGGVNVADLYSMGQKQPQQTVPAAGGWTCSCGTQNTGKFCSNCGSPMPAPANQWTCSCGTQNTGKFCSNCGSPMPAANGPWTCSCGTQNTGKFCANCGSPRP